MSLRTEQINEIKNLNLIYIYKTNSIFQNDEKKYIGVKVIYNDKYMLNGKYDDSNFSYFIKRILDRYNKEKDSRKIILLGDLTKELVKSSSFDFSTQKKESNQIPYFSANNKILSKYKNYIYEVFSLIIKNILKYESFKIEDIKGFNRKYKLTLNISGQKREYDLIIYSIGNELYFKSNMFSDKTHILNGNIKEKLGSINIEFNYDNFKGYIVYDALNNENVRHIELNDSTFYHVDTLDTVLNEDKEFINAYLKYINDTNDYNILKINDRTFLMNKIDENNSDDDLLYTNTNILFNIDKNEIRIIKNIKEGFTKYNGEINVELDKSILEIVFKKINLYQKNYLIIEINNNNDYEYRIKEINDESLENFKDFTNIEKIEAESIETIKKYIKKGAL